MAWAFRSKGQRQQVQILANEVLTVERAAEDGYRLSAACFEVLNELRASSPGLSAIGKLEEALGVSSAKVNALVLDEEAFFMAEDTGVKCPACHQRIQDCACRMAPRKSE